MIVASAIADQLGAMLRRMHPEGYWVPQAGARSVRGAAADASAPGPVTEWTWAALVRLKPLATDCLYADQRGWRSCGCRACWARGDARYPVREVSLRECLECMALTVDLDPVAPTEEG